MQAFKEFFIAILTGYLALADSLAFQIIEFLPEPVEEVIVEETEDSDFLSDLSTLPSRIGDIPQILLNSPDFQAASVISSGGFDGANTEDPLDAIVNIFCTLVTDDYIRTTTGTGFYIDPDGIIMTNAHVAQFLLLESTDSFGDAKCTVRGGNPAVAQYQAELLYLPPAWLQTNASLLTDTQPLGTGERDYALLYVSQTLDNTPLPAQFPALGFDSALLPITTKDTSVTAAGYPAANLIANGVNTDLLPKKAETTVSELYTFGSNYADVFSIRGTEVGEQGASGGPIVNENGAVIGLIVTRGDDATDGEGSLRAITLSHIDRTITEETGFTLAENLSGNLAFRAQVFNQTVAPFLVQILEQSN